MPTPAAASSSCARTSNWGGGRLSAGSGRRSGKAGAPLVESIPGDAGSSLVTFVWRGDSKTRNVVIFDGVAGFDAKDRMTQIDGADVNDTLDSFVNIKDDGAMKKRLAMFRTNPLNPRRCPATFGKLSAESSYLELSATPPQPRNAPVADAPKGAVIATTFRSGILKNERKLWIYTPSGFSKSGAPYPLLVLFDGDRTVKWIPAILDNLIAQKRIPPMVAALIHNPSTAARNLELPCYPPFADFLATELVRGYAKTIMAPRKPQELLRPGPVTAAWWRSSPVFGIPKFSAMWRRYRDPFGGSRSTAATRRSG